MSNASENLNWLLDDLVDRVVGADHAIVLSADGLLIGRSRGLTDEEGEHLSAVASAFQSLARGTSRQFKVEARTGRKTQGLSSAPMRSPGAAPVPRRANWT